MSRRAACCLLIAAAVAAAPGAALAGAWTLPAGQGQVITTGTLSSAQNVFDSNRTVVSAPTYSKFELQALFEYGLTDRLTAIVLPGLQHVEIESPSASRTGLGYTEFGGRYRFMGDANWVFSGQATVRMPGTFDTANPAAIGYTDVETDVRALVGYAFTLGSMPAYIDVQLAQRFRSGPPPNELRADATLGVQIAPQWLILAQLFNVFSEGEGSTALFPSYDYHKAQLGFAYGVAEHWSLLAGGFTTFSGRNALQENGLQLGVWYKF